MNGQSSTATATAGMGSGARAFTLHLGEMLLAMVGGMVVLGGAVAGALAVAGGSLSNGPAALTAAVMAFSMTMPMVAWMRYRGHSARHNAEMAASMVVPSAAVIALHWLGTLSSEGVLVAQHAVMIPAMVAVMLYRYEHYSH